MPDPQDSRSAATPFDAGRVRSQAVENVDRRHGYTLEFSNQPNCHALEYDEEEERLTAELRGRPRFASEPYPTGVTGGRSVVICYCGGGDAHEWRPDGGGARILACLAAPIREPEADRG